MEVEENKNKGIDQNPLQNAEDLTNIADTPEHHDSIERSRPDTREQIVPVLEEDYSISKQTSIKEAKIEKRAVTKTKTVKVPITYEELYINGKKLKTVDAPRILSALKDKITGMAGSSGNTGPQ